MKHKNSANTVEPVLSLIIAILSILALVLLFWNAAAIQASSNTEHRDGYRASMIPVAGIQQYARRIINAPKEGNPFLGTMQERIAARLEKRLRKWNLPVPPFTTIVGAVVQRQSLLKRGVMAIVRVEHEQTSMEWKLSPQEHPDWIVPDLSPASFSFNLSEGEVRRTIEDKAFPGYPKPVNAQITGVSDETGILRAVMTGTALHGYVLDADDILSKFTGAIQSETPTIEVALHHEPGRIINLSDTDLGSMEFLATGQSSFQDSVTNRVWNIKKALGDGLQNILIAPGETFSFNRALENAIPSEKPWRLAKVIFNGSELRDAPGGGICQTSTTFFRAAVLAGVDIRTRKNHSLFVSYYEKYGLGLDATVFPKKQDFTFVNDTPGYILVQTATDDQKKIAYISLYGTYDGRSVSLEGPIFSSNAPADFEPEGKPLKRSDIAWIQRITGADGTTVERTHVSHYNAIPKKFHTMDHTSAPTDIAPPLWVAQVIRDRVE